MEQLLKITSVPITLDYKVNNARLEHKNANASLEISRDKGGLKIKSQPIKLDIDSTDCYNSIRPSHSQSIKQAAEKGEHAAYEATAAYAREGKLFLNAKVGEDMIGKIVASREAPPNTNFTIDFLPKVKPELNWTEPELSIEYELDKLNFDWKVMNGDFEFVPGSIEISITQMPDVIVEYVGKPIYVPASADPEYVPETDVRA